ncbi:MAG: Na/Pi cotransporter family protein [Pseudomonadota bacterium]
MGYTLFDFFTLLGSLGLFLYGMKVMSDALMEVAGDKMRNILATMTSHRLLAVASGFLMTAVIQSSSATTLMVVSFSNAGLLTLQESIGVIMGANIGTTVTAWLITLLGFKVSVSALVLPFVALGFLLTLSNNRIRKQWGHFIIGLAVLFLGLQFLKDAVPDINSHPQALEFLSDYTGRGMLSVLLFLFIGTLLTVIVQSSSATMAITLIMCFEGWIPFDMAAAMVLGENIGTTITANIAALMANYHAKRTARAHLIFNMIGVLWMLLLFYPFLQAVDRFVTGIEGASPFVQAAAIPVALSVFHTAFNLINTFVLIWFVPLIARIVKRLVPEQIDPKKRIDQPKFLSEEALKYPQTGLQALLNESKRLFEKTTYMVLAHGLNVHRSEIESEKSFDHIPQSTAVIRCDIDDVYYRKMKTIYNTIVEFATRLQSTFTLGEEKIGQIRNILVANRLMVEIVKDMKGVHKNMSRYISSDNPVIRQQYNIMRMVILEMSRHIHQIKSSQHPHKHLKKLKKLREKAERHDVLMDGTIDRLVRSSEITSEMATSLMNDNVSATAISRNLVAIVELLYIQSDTIFDEDQEMAGEGRQVVERGKNYGSTL